MKQYKYLKKVALVAICILFALSFSLQGEPLYKDADQPLEKRVNDLVDRMTMEEKAAMVNGEGFSSKTYDRLDIPALKMTDGPVGVRWGESVAFPVSINMASSWNKDLIKDVGQALGEETKGQDRNVLLGPCINIHWVPHNGRNFENFGEDPYLAGELAESYIKGVQSENVVATAKHYLANNQEYKRNSIDVKVGERALREIYLPAFKKSVQEGNVWAIMSSYNRINGHYASSNTYLLEDILKDEWGFDGLVMSDWGAVHSVVPTLYGGLDLEMPTAGYLTQEDVLAAVSNNRIRKEKLNDKVKRMIRAMMAQGIFDNKLDEGSVGTEEHKEVALEMARESMILLKNEGDLLPLDKDELNSVAVVGPTADEAVTGGGGSSQVDPISSVTPLEAIKKEAGNDIEVKYQRGIFDEELDLKPVGESVLRTTQDGEQINGLQAKYYDNSSFSGEPTFEQVDKEIDFNVGQGTVDERVGKEHFSIEWTGTLVPSSTGDYIIGTSSDDGTRVFLNGDMIIDNWGKHGIVTKTDTLSLKEGQEYDLRIKYYEQEGGAAFTFGWQKVDLDSLNKAREMAQEKAVEAAQNSDAVILCTGLGPSYESEGYDREELTLPAKQEKLIQAIAEANENTAVVMNNGSDIIMNKWIDQVPALLEAWYPGQEGGTAVSDIVFGNVNPSGKLPFSMIKKWKQSPAYDTYPEEEGKVYYDEGIFVGYRYYEKENIKPRFPFGHGLSYTEFEYDDLNLNKTKMSKDGTIKATLTIENTGDRKGAEVVQMYIQDSECIVPRPKKELKGFDKVELEPGESTEVTFEIDKEDLSFYDTRNNTWKTEAGKFKIKVGRSSQDIRLKDSFKLK